MHVAALWRYPVKSMAGEALRRVTVTASGFLGDRIVQMTAGAAATVGTAAGLAVSAPVAVIDPQSRETYGEHLRNLSQGIGDTAEGAVDLATAPARALGGR